MFDHSVSAINAYVTIHSDFGSIADFKSFCDSSTQYSDVFVCDGYRLCRAAKLLMSLGYGNFSTAIQYDVYAQAKAVFDEFGGFDEKTFKVSKNALRFSKFEAPTILNSPNLSILPLLAYHKICNDHYRNEKWQSFEPWTCNIDYLKPDDNMNAMDFIKSSTFTSLMTSILDLENSNLPIDYFTSVLPRAQYGDESGFCIVTGKQIGRAHV